MTVGESPIVHINWKVYAFFSILTTTTFYGLNTGHICTNLSLDKMKKVHTVQDKGVLIHIFMFSSIKHLSNGERLFSSQKLMLLLVNT